MPGERYLLQQNYPYEVKVWRKSLDILTTRYSGGYGLGVFLV